MASSPVDGVVHQEVRIGDWTATFQFYLSDGIKSYLLGMPTLHDLQLTVDCLREILVGNVHNKVVLRYRVRKN